MKLIKELLEGRFEVQNPIKDIKAELGSDFYIDDMSGENTLIVYQNDAREEDDDAVQVDFERWGGPEVVTLKLYSGDATMLKTVTFKPHFSSPTSKGYFEVDEIANEIHNLLRDAEYHKHGKFNFADLHDDPEIRDQLRMAARMAKMGRRGPGR